jgi:hypothetical protein
VKSSMIGHVAEANRIFGIMTGHMVRDYVGYGNYCGPGGSGLVLDPIDEYVYRQYFTQISFGILCQLSFRVVLCILYVRWYIETLDQPCVLNRVVVMCLTPHSAMFSYIVAVSFIGGGNLSTLRKPLTNFFT